MYSRQIVSFSTEMKIRIPKLIIVMFHRRNSSFRYSISHFAHYIKEKHMKARKQLPYWISESRRYCNTTIWLLCYDDRADIRFNNVVIYHAFDVLWHCASDCKRDLIWSPPNWFICCWLISCWITSLFPGWSVSTFWHYCSKLFTHIWSSNDKVATLTLASRKDSVAFVGKIYNN